ncbi:hypothetical protein CLOSTHATH_05545 [Hungatella hathewayi DSM 13479]|uniref:Uncharacterized protein n=1 Tax=Hungatella hathewayi DSM 13479 TaxID=566550 RepID=D3APJ3_9FIRM|nr:hypothetical protein CLOSTHATH_05545 [Hungatella hathewayi DSM 13479]
MRYAGIEKKACVVSSRHAFFMNIDEEAHDMRKGPFISRKFPSHKTCKLTHALP